MDAFFVQKILKIDPFGVSGLDQCLAGELCLGLAIIAVARGAVLATIQPKADIASRVAQNDEESAPWPRANSECSQAM